ncbi:MAG TPA: hypothetical protein VI278_08570 [Nitrososphaeraceae archaeon]
MLLLKNKEVMPIHVAEQLNLALHGVSSNKHLNIERGRSDNNNRNQKVTKQVLFIEQEYEIRANMTFDDTYDYSLNSKEYAENKESKWR